MAKVLSAARMAADVTDVWGMLWVPLLRYYQVTEEQGNASVDLEAADAAIYASLFQTYLSVFSALVCSPKWSPNCLEHPRKSPPQFSAKL